MFVKIRAGVGISTLIKLAPRVIAIYAMGNVVSQLGFFLINPLVAPLAELSQPFSVVLFLPFHRYLNVS